MDALSELLTRVSDFAAGRLSRIAVADWFVDALWNVEESAVPETLAVFHKVEGILAEASHAQWDEDILRKELTRQSPEPAPSVTRAS